MLLTRYDYFNQIIKAYHLTLLKKNTIITNANN